MAVVRIASTEVLGTADVGDMRVEAEDGSLFPLRAHQSQEVQRWQKHWRKGTAQKFASEFLILRDNNLFYRTLDGQDMPIFAVVEKAARAHVQKAALTGMAARMAMPMNAEEERAMAAMTAKAERAAYARVPEQALTGMAARMAMPMNAEEERAMAGTAAKTERRNGCERRVTSMTDLRTLSPNDFRLVDGGALLPLRDYQTKAVVNWLKGKGSHMLSEEGGRLYYITKDMSSHMPIVGLAACTPKAKQAAKLLATSAVGGANVAQVLKESAVRMRALFAARAKKKTLHAIRRMYTMTPGGALDDMANFLQGVWAKHGKSINSSTKLLVPRRWAQQYGTAAAYERAVLTSLVLRYPVYFGQPKTDMYDAAAVHRVLGYDPATVPKPDTRLHYGILGPLVLEDKPNEVPGKRAWALHVWGQNFEKAASDDSKQYLKGTGLAMTVDKVAIGVIMDDLFGAVLAAVQHLRDVKTQGLIVVRVPLVGLGAFLSYPQQQGADAVVSTVKRTYYGAAAKTGKKAKAMNAVVHILNYGGFVLDASEFPKFKAGSGVVMQSKAPQHDLFAPLQAKATTILVNAWDSRSFVGNGLDDDNTIDGFMVAGIGPGGQMRNSSFLHNVFTSPALLERKAWVQY
jgi:hypothetical protein